MPGVIVKTAFSKPQLQGLLQRKLQQIAFLQGANLYLVASDSPLEDAKRFAGIPGIDYAQPDISQPRTPAGKASFSQAAGHDIRALWRDGAGDAVKIAVIDDGFDLQHPDLAGIKIGFAYDADDKMLDAAPKSPSDQHGTEVVGIIFARHNDIGIDGIAPAATLIPIRQAGTRTSDTVLALTVADMAGADIINCSWNSPMLMEPVRDIIDHLAKHGRHGLGSVIVFAAGNEGETLWPDSREAAMDSVLTIGASEGGAIAPYSNRGEIVDLYLPGQMRTTRQTGYGSFNGTSASAALASGLAALLLGKQPGLPLNELRTQVISTAARIWPAPAAALRTTKEEERLRKSSIRTADSPLAPQPEQGMRE